MPARFRKVSKEPLFDFDGFDADGGYQMVPTGGEPRFLGALGGQGATLTNSNSSIVRMERFTSTIPLATATIDKAVLPPNAQVEFALNGVKPGSATLSLRNAAGRLEDELTISVKAPRLVTLSIAILRDLRRQAAFDRNIVMAMLPPIFKTYKQQVNVDFKIINGPEILQIDKDLKDPLKPEESEIGLAIHDATPKLWFLSDLIIYCTWNIELLGGKKDLAGLNIGKTCFVENSNSLFFTRATFAHEVGHGLGLDHNNIPDGMMNPRLDATHTRFRQFEIDHMNKSGT